MLKFAANLSMMFTELPFLDRFAAAAAAGFQGVEYLFPYEYPHQQLAEQLQRHRLQQVLFNTAPGNTTMGEWGLAALPERQDAARAHIDLALQYAIALNCPSVHIMAGVVPKGAVREQYWQTFIANVRYAADRFAPYNIQILIEALSPVVKPNYLFSSQWQARELLTQIDRHNVFIQLDVFHAQLVDGNLTHLLQQLHGRYRHIQIASVPDRHEPDDGEINYPFLFNLLVQLGYQGWIGCEYQPKTHTVDGLAWANAYLSPPCR